MKQSNLVNYTEDTEKKMYDLTAQLLASQISKETGLEINVTTGQAKNTA